ncbi:hypothetical protein [Novosphingobium sp. 9U]|uniref:hypothetical protein n=1 Tax=Novosphingobium sp. 9U TaxID=2653158 RepID=UPI0012F2617F|nr:hypothetical protein [Novosphingobium sp. 9U]VWX48950.1 conserved hypothetical protein [Novosphingobium sp. 9U]
MLFTAIIFASALGLPIAPEAERRAPDVAYAELAAGNAVAALRKLEEPSVDRSDPAVLINLGSAYARQGATDKALAALRAAVTSSERYDLELADGSWMDSREVARIALAKLQRGAAQAAR